MATIDGDELHEMTFTSAASDVRHKTPYDNSHKLVWIHEPPTVSGVLTQDGITQIAFHKYVGGKYTTLDTLLNPLWTKLTDFLPMSVAPNLVSACGGLHCMVAYLVTWQYSHNFDEMVPNWVLVLNAYCQIAYYTLDCMDGKQARRTNSSSPLGQLFDHGIDCVCLLTHLSSVDAWVTSNRSPLFYSKQAFLQFSFFVAQWEEYHTGMLPHATGDIGVTEVNYALGLVSLVAVFLDRDHLFDRSPQESFHRMIGLDLGRILDVLSVSGEVRQAVDSLSFRDVFLIGWMTMMTVLIALSIVRVYRTTSSFRLAAMTKLVSPFLLAFAPLALPTDVVKTKARWLHLAVGVGMCLITIKMIVFSMAKQAYAAFQIDILPTLLAIAWICHDERIKPAGVHLLFQVLFAGYLARIIHWNMAAIRQICERLNIRLFRIYVKED